jgi:hypothetical protein
MRCEFFVLVGTLIAVNLLNAVVGGMTTVIGGRGASKLKRGWHGVRHQKCHWWERWTTEQAVDRGAGKDAAINHRWGGWQWPQKMAAAGVGIAVGKEEWPRHRQRHLRYGWKRCTRPSRAVASRRMGPFFGDGGSNCGDGNFTRRRKFN